MGRNSVDKIAVSVILPIYNMEKYLKECLNSIINQTLQDIEIICINDGSTDCTIEILEKYKSSDGRIVIINQENSGASAARNRGIEEARGEFLAFVDPDDFYLENDVLECLYNAAIEHNVSICGGGQCRLAEGKIKYATNILPIFEKEQMINYNDYQFPFGYMRYIYKRELIISQSIRFPLYKRCQDPLFLVRAGMAAEKIWGIPKVVYCARYVDKKIEYSNEEIIYGYCFGIAEVMGIAEQNDMKILFETMWRALKDNYLIPLYRDVLEKKPGAIKAYNCLRRLSERKYFENMYIVPEEYLNEYAKEQYARTNEFVREVQLASGIIIYGAREKAKRIYDCIDEKFSKGDKVKFVVSDLADKNTTARGKKVHILSDIPCKGELVILTISPEAENTVKENLMKKGFDKIIRVDVDALQFVDYQ